jgi:hypothetical protein
MTFFERLLGKKSYRKRLNATKQFYSFGGWGKRYYVEKIFDDLITSLIEIGENASEEQKKELFKIAIMKTNKLNDEVEGLIETDEREYLSELTNKISLASGLDPNKYGEGLASEWREW